MSKQTSDPAAWSDAQAMEIAKARVIDACTAESVQFDPTIIILIIQVIIAVIKACIGTTAANVQAQCKVPGPLAEVGMHFRMGTALLNHYGIGAWTTKNGEGLCRSAFRAGAMSSEAEIERFMRLPMP